MGGVVGGVVAGTTRTLFSTGSATDSTHFPKLPRMIGS